MPPAASPRQRLVHGGSNDVCTITSQVVCVGISSCWLTVAHAEEPAVSETTEISRRLEEAEQRIGDLEARRLPAVGVSHTLNTAWNQDDAEDSLADRVESLEKALEKQKGKGSEGQVGQGQEADAEMVRPCSP